MAQRVSRSETYWVMRRAGRRTVVIGLGGVAIFTGFNLILAEQSTSRLNAMYAFLQLAPIAAWGGLWLVAGVVAIAGAFVPRTNDRWGLDALAFTYGLWASEYLLVGLTYSRQALTGAALYAVILAIVFTIANMRRVNPPKVTPHVQRH